MTKREKEINKQITDLENELSKLSKTKPVKEKALFNTNYFTTTKIILHSIQILVIAIMGFVVYMCKFLIDEPMYLSITLGSLITGISFTFNAVNKHYIDKAQSDSDNMNKKERYGMKMKLAEKMTELLANNKISADGVNLLKAVISETETSLTTNPYGGYVIEQQTYSAQNPTINDGSEMPIDYTGGER